MIEIRHPYYLDYDEQNWMLIKKGIVTKEGAKTLGEEKFETLGYYSKLSQLGGALIERQVKDGCPGSLLDLLCSIRYNIDNFKQWVDSRMKEGGLRG